MNKNLVSIIVPIYNVENYLDRCLESIVNQTHTNLEIILVDDGSTDCGPTKCDDWAKKDNRIKVIHKKNGGLSDARNEGIENATGEFLCFIDSDDFVHEMFVETLLNNLIETNSDLSICSFSNVYEGKKLKRNIINDCFLYEGHGVQNALFEKYNLPFVSACTKLYKRMIFDKLRFDVGRINEDQFIAHKVLAQCKKVVYTKSQLYYYYHRTGSIMRSKNFTERNLDDFVAMLSRYDYFKGTIFKDKALNQLVNNICYLYRLARSRKADKKILTYLRENFEKYYKLNKHKSFRQRVFRVSPNLYCFIVKLLRK